jgi:hypothetical protein
MPSESEPAANLGGAIWKPRKMAWLILEGFLCISPGILAAAKRRGPWMVIAAITSLIALLNFAEPSVVSNSHPGLSWFFICMGPLFAKNGALPKIKTRRQKMRSIGHCHEMIWPCSFVYPGQNWALITCSDYNS